MGEALTGDSNLQRARAKAGETRIMATAPEATTADTDLPLQVQEAKKLSTIALLQPPPLKFNS